MNFSNTNQLRKILSLVIALAMMATLFAGCMKKDKAEETTEPPFTVLPPTATTPETQPVPTETEELNENMAIVLNQLYIRHSPSESAPMLGTLYAGDKVEVIDIQESLEVKWGLIKVPNSNEEGWICMDYVDYKGSTTAPEDNTPDETQPENNGSDESGNNDNTTVMYRGTVSASNLNIRKSPSTSADKVGTLEYGARVEIFEKKGDWGRIEKGWISLQHVKLDNGSNSGSNSGNSNNNNNSSSSKSDIESDGSTKVVYKGIVNTGELNVRTGPSSSADKVGTLKKGTRVEAFQKKNGWGRVKEGWISLSYVYQDGSGDDGKIGTVTGSSLRIRSGPGTDYDSIGALDEGDEVEILFQTNGWGNIKEGWISMKYVELDDSDDDVWEDDEDDKDDVEVDEGNGSTKVLYSGFVTADKLNVRSSASGSSDKVGSLGFASRVSILEEDGDWGRTKNGWVSLDYIYQSGSGDDDDDGTVTADGVRLRSGPSKEYDVIGSLEEGDDVTILYVLGDWGDTGDGWIYMDYVDLD